MKTKTYHREKIKREKGRGSFSVTKRTLKSEIVGLQNLKASLAMATKGHHIGRATYHFLPAMDGDSVSDSLFEFDEAELYNVNSARANSPEFHKSVRSSRFHGNSSSSGGRVGAPASVPVNVPDWSKILGNEYRQSRRRNQDEDGDDDGGDDDGGGRVPPHEFLARTRITSFSVHEGVGRTLKGRDLSRVRNAIWAKTGFQD